MNEIKVLLAVGYDHNPVGIQSCIQAEDGFELIGLVSNGKEAVEQLVTKKPDLVVLFDKLADCSGIEVIGFTRKSGLPIDFILVCSSNDGWSINRAFRLGVIDCILSPFEVERIGRALRAYRLFQQQLSCKRDRQLGIYTI